MRGLAFLLSVLYFALAHAATLSGRSELRVAALLLLTVLLLYALRGLPWLQLGLLLAGGACFALAEQPLLLLLYAPTVLIPLLLAGLVGRSLLPGRQPLIERVIWHLHGRPAALSPQHVRYARAVTLYWCAVFVAMAALNLALARWAPPALWSWVGNIACYGVPPLAMLAEYAWRKRVFPVQQYRNVFDYLARLIRLGPTLAAEIGRDFRRDLNAAPVVRP